MNNEESRIQAECYKWFNNNYCLKFHDPRLLMFSVPNELAGRNKIATIQGKAIGLTSGVSDTIIITPKEVLFIEFKTPTGRQSKAQKEFQKRVNDLNRPYFIIRSFEEFKQLILTIV